MKLLNRVAMLALGLSMNGLAMAALPFGQLSFVEPVATVGNTEIIDVRVRFTLDPTSSALNFSNNPLTGFDPSDLPTQGYYDNPLGTRIFEDFASIDRAFLNTYFSCSDSFTNGCSDGTASYAFDFHTSSAPGEPSIVFLTAFTLQPGESYEYLFGQFTPKSGGADPGTYDFYDTGVTLNFEGTSVNGNALKFDVTIANSCVSTPSGCDPVFAFTRNVMAAVPEAHTYAMMLAALGLLGLKTHRRHAHS